MFSQTTEYALRAAVWLAQREGSPQTNKDIADATQVPAGYLSKVLQSLSRAGLVHGSRGKHGGFELARAADDITILEIVNSVDPIRRIHSCPLKLKSHRMRLCPLHRRMDQALALIEESFCSVTLAQLVGESADARPLCENVAIVGAVS